MPALRTFRRPVALILAPALGLGALALSSQGTAAEDPVRRELRRASDTVQERIASTIDVYRDHSSWDDPWEYTSAHYAVRTTKSRFHARQMAEGLETMLGHFRTILATEWAPTSPAPVYMFPTLELYNALGNAVGGAESSVHGSFFAASDPARPIAVLHDNGSAGYGNMWATHGAFLQFADGAYRGAAPTWVTYGLASYFSLYWDAQWTLSEFEKVKSSGRYIALRQLLPQRIDAYATDSHSRFIQLAALFHYLLDWHEPTRNTRDDAGNVVPGPFASYLKTILEGGRPADHELHALFTQDIDALDADLREFGWE